MESYPRNAAIATLAVCDRNTSARIALREAYEPRLWTSGNLRQQPTVLDFVTAKGSAESCEPAAKERRPAHEEHRVSSGKCLLLQLRSRAQTTCRGSGPPHPVPNHVRVRPPTASNACDECLASV
ncbi:hypothetical protein L226DRAFT_278579 [Lentinus tigrinus ALCF2SS1-7]|uniref:Uncharacterized protein n=1 Tax=Lentinus tigrinus ALCF2SS1-6 TaxID=1328759 RepID=A0A5C2RUV1_9APHY|nr:hypothetical protein L227DRAFT_353149 [Lentinus tigrinus ALCF2SS1-6]RPD69250.1 hypothetical protein L226DRAFT_278579 [Lentinus tigrinus ALCF2SS1-7]